MLKSDIETWEIGQVTDARRNIPHLGLDGIVVIVLDI
jgi:hypothetical protein